MAVVEYRPTGQAAQVRSADAEPCALTNSPGAQLFQGRQTASLAPFVKVPAAQAAHWRFDNAVPPALTKLPDAQVAQVLQVVAVPPTDHVPASQGLHVPDDRNRPGAHVAAAQAASGSTKTNIDTSSASVGATARHRRMTAPSLSTGTMAGAEAICDDLL